MLRTRVQLVSAANEQARISPIDQDNATYEECTELVRLFQTAVQDKLLEYLCNGGGSARLGQRARDVRGTAREFDLE